MKGQFIFPTMNALGVRVRPIIRNSTHGREKWPGLEKNPDFDVDLRIFQNGALKFREEHFARVPLNKTHEIPQSLFEKVLGADQDGLIVANISTPEGGGQYFYQAHQLILEHKTGQKHTSLIYEHLPLPPSTKKPNPIVLMAPKAWVSSSLSTYVMFPNGWDTTETAWQADPMNLTVLGQDGKTLYQESHRMRYNDVWIFDVKQAIQDKVALTDKPQFINIVARGGSSMFPVITLVKNERSGALAFEHSFFPPYYTSGDLARVRQEAIRLDLASEAVTL